MPQVINPANIIIIAIIFFSTIFLSQCQYRGNGQDCQVPGRGCWVGATAWAQPGRSGVLSLCYYMLCRAVGKVVHLVAHKYTHFSARTKGAITTFYHNSTLCYTPLSYTMLYAAILYLCRAYSPCICSRFSCIQ